VPPSNAEAARRRILLVDDEPEIIDVLREYLEGVYDVDSAVNASQALERIHAHRPDLVFLDIDMPGTNGVEALRLIKKIDETILVLMLTANIDNALAAEAIALGAFSYIPKPFNLTYLEHLLAAAWSTLKQREARAG
jgi:DNA-binding NtrC family response regulator